MAMTPEELLAQGFEPVPDNSPEALKAQGYEAIDAPTVEVTGKQYEDYVPKEDVTSWSNRFKNALASDVGIVAGGATLAAAPSPVTQLMSRAIFDKLPPEIQQYLSQSTFGNTGENMAQTQQQALESMGGQPIPQPSDLGGQVQEMAAQGLVDPLSYIGTPLKGVVGTGINLVKMAGANTLATPAIVGGGEAGQQIEQVISQNKETSGVGKLFGSLVGGGASVLTQGTASNLLNAGAIGTKALIKGYLNKDEAVKAFSSSAVKGFLEQTARAEGVDNLTEVVDNFSKINKEITGESAPILTAMSTNPMVMATYKGLIQTDPDFRAKVTQEIAGIREKISTKATSLFGPSALDITPSDSVIAESTLKRLADVQERVSFFDNKINELSNRFNTDMTGEQLGKSIENLVKAKEKYIRENEISPLYESVKTDAAAAKATLPAEGTRMIYNFVKENNLQDLFTKGSRIELDINKYFKAGKDGYPEVSFSNIVSLKNNINELKREFTPGTNEFRRINELSKKVDEARLMIPGDFNERLKNADKLYYQRLGVPFNEQGILDIDSKKYAEQVAPVITKTPSALDDFLQVTGKQGEEIARNAILSDFYNSVKGEVTPKNLAAFMFKRKDVISKIPGLEDDFKIGLVDGEAFHGTRLELNDKAVALQKQIADNFFLSAGGNGIDYSKVSSQMLGDRRYLEKVKTDLKDLAPDVRDAVDNTLKRAVVDNILSHPNGALNFMLQPDNQKTVALILGKDYVDSVKNMATISDSLARINPNKIGILPSKEEGDLIGRMIPGLTIPSVSSILRNRIISDTQKVITLASKVSQDLVLKKTTDSLESILMDKDGLIAFNNTVKDLDLKNPVDLKKAVQAYSRLLPSRTLMSVRNATAQSEEKQPTIQVQEGGFE